VAFGSQVCSALVCKLEPYRLYAHTEDSMLAPALSFTHVFTKDGDSLSESECSTRSGDRECATHHYRFEVYSVEETWGQDPLDGSDSDAESGIYSLSSTPDEPLADFDCPSLFTPGVMPDPHQDARCPSYAAQDQQANHSGNSDAEQNESDFAVQNAHKRNMRPCKAKRDKFRKFIDHLKIKVRLELENFDIDSVELPSGVAHDPKAVARVRSMMERYQREVLQGVLPDLDAIASRKSATKSSGVPLHLAMYLSR